MRDPARINRVLAQLREYWTQGPDLRLCQIVGNMLNAEFANGRFPDPVMESRGYNTEDDKVEKYLVSENTRLREENARKADDLLRRAAKHREEAEALESEAARIAPSALHVPIFKATLEAARQYAKENPTVTYEVCQCGRLRGAPVHHFGAQCGHAFEPREPGMHGSRGYEKRGT